MQTGMESWRCTGAAFPAGARAVSGLLNLCDRTDGSRGLRHSGSSTAVCRIEDSKILNQTRHSFFGSRRLYRNWLAHENPACDLSKGSGKEVRAVVRSDAGLECNIQ